MGIWRRLKNRFLFTMHVSCKPVLLLTSSPNNYTYKGRGREIEHFNAPPPYKELKDLSIVKKLTF